MTARGPARLVGWTQPVRPVPAPPTVPVPARVVDELRAAVLEHDAAPEGSRRACLDEVLGVVRALLDDAPKEA